MRLQALLIALATAAAAVPAACGGQTGMCAASSCGVTGSPPPTSATAKGPCAAVHAGETGVIGTYCNGTAVFKVTVGSVSKEIDGGTCQTSGGLFVALGGVVTDHTFLGSRPDFVSVNTPPAGGADRRPPQASC